jgi:hypothetical protein
MVHDPQASGVASLLLGLVKVGVGKSIKWPWVDPCRLEVLCWLVSLGGSFFASGL